MSFFDPPLAPFIIALLLMLFIAALELIGMLGGFGISDLIDSAIPDFDADVDGLDAPDGGPLGEILGWLAVGKVPLLVLIVSFLTAFGLSGLVGQTAIKSVTGHYLPGLTAGLGALTIALPATRHIGLAIARIMPKEETDAVSHDTFIGNLAEIIRGEAKIGAPAEAKLKDFTGKVHYLLVEPDEDGVVFSQGDKIILVRKNGAVFHGILNTSTALAGN